MIKYYKTDDKKIHEETGPGTGVWINIVNPTEDEAQHISSELNIDVQDIKAACDEEETSRVELEDGYTLILVDLPVPEVINDVEGYTTIPLGIIITQDSIITVSTVESPVLAPFINNRVKEFSTKKKLRFVYQILFRITAQYQAYLRLIDKKRTAIEENIGGGTEDDDIISLHSLESTLVYFATSLRANGAVLDRLTRYKRLEQYPDDKELLDDVITENKQAIEMTTIYRDIISGTRDLLSTIINNKINDVMKYLTSITLVLGIPNIISGMYGMNVNSKGVPLAHTVYGFTSIVIGVIIICGIALLILKRKKLL
ncbi:MAG: magnesium transporter CorA family protein [Lachnospiraceae bacterium]|nr:magnesium transporter CorA family protein [Lachnospiraceae bacterium]